MAWKFCPGNKCWNNGLSPDKKLLFVGGVQDRTYSIINVYNIAKPGNIKLIGSFAKKTNDFQIDGYSD